MRKSVVFSARVISKILGPYVLFEYLAGAVDSFLGSLSFHCLQVCTKFFYISFISVLYQGCPTFLDQGQPESLSLSWGPQHFFCF